MPDLTKNRDQLILEAADKLSLVGTGQPLEAEYREKINGNIDPMVAQLFYDAICHVADTDNIPAQWFDCLAGLLANICAPLGGKQFDPSVKQYLEMMLKRVNASDATYEVLEGVYY